MHASTSWGCVAVMSALGNKLDKEATDVWPVATRGQLVPVYDTLSLESTILLISNIKEFKAREGKKRPKRLSSSASFLSMKSQPLFIFYCAIRGLF